MHRRTLLKALIAAGCTPPLEAQVAPRSQPAKMLTRKIPSSGEALPVIGLGTWQSFDVPNEGRAALEAVLREFVALGGSVIDSSPMYGRSEEVAGDLIAQLGVREKLFVATKVWTTGRDAGIAQMAASENKLKAKRLDLLQVHNLQDIETHMQTLQGWKATGRVRYIGVTHYTSSAYDAVAKAMRAYPLDFLQINYSVGERAAEKTLLPLAKERGIAVIVNRPFAGGELFRRLRATPLPAWAGEIGCTSWAQLMLKFVLSHPAVTCAIPATSRIEHLRENMAAGAGAMPDEKMRANIADSVG